VPNFLRTRLIPFCAQTFDEWQQSGCVMMGAALSYYATLSMFPLALVVVNLAGSVAGSTGRVQVQLLRMAQASMPELAYSAVAQTLGSLGGTPQRSGLIGFALLFFAASGVFVQLATAFDRIWEVAPARAALGIASALDFLRRRALAFALVLGCALLVLVSLAIDVVLELLQEAALEMAATVGFVKPGGWGLVGLLQPAVSLVVLMLVVLLIFKAMPSTKVAWGDVWPGALLSACLLFGLQQLAAGGVVAIGSHYEFYGLAGAFLALMLWIYFAGQILLAGGVFTHVYARLFGSLRAVATVV